MTSPQVLELLRCIEEAIEGSGESRSAIVETYRLDGGIIGTAQPSQDDSISGATVADGNTVTIPGGYAALSVIWMPNTPENSEVDISGRCYIAGTVDIDDGDAPAGYPSVLINRPEGRADYSDSITITASGPITDPVDGAAVLGAKVEISVKKYV